jgi:pimeloyl-ACP methyl ester carboxylesterase
MNRTAFLVAAGSALASTTALPSASRADDADITLATKTGNIFGTLTLPAAPGRVPVVIIIAGSGPTDRDGNSPLLPGKGDTQKLLASALAARGIASVRYDKRGIAASRLALSSESDIRFDSYIDDAAAWVAMLRSDGRFSHVTIAGHSEGSLIGMVAARTAAADGFVSLEGAGRPATVVLREQLRKLPPATYAQADAVIASLQAGKTVSDVPPELAALFRPSVQPYLISWFRYDPAAEIAKLRIPVTIVQGTADVQVTMTDANALAGANPRAKLVVVPGMNHVLKHAPDTSSQTAILSGYTDPALPVEPAVTDAVATIAFG